MDEKRSKEVWAEITEFAASKDAAGLRRVVEEQSAGHRGVEAAVREHESHLRHAVEKFAEIPGADSLELLGELVREGHHRPGVKLPALATRLAEHHRVADLSEVVFRRQWDFRDDLRVCLFHDLVLRGVDVEDFPGLRDFRVPERHALSWLPRVRLEAEDDVLFPDEGAGFDGLPRGVARLDPPTPRTQERASIRDTLTHLLHEEVVASPRDGGWAHDAGRFEFVEPVDPADVPALLPTLPLRCLEGLGPSDRFEIAQETFSEIWYRLWQVASWGGCWSSGVSSAYGRLAAWRSMAALSGAADRADAVAVERHAAQSSWFRFDADSDWFFHEIWDYGFAALSPDRLRLTVLVATDTD